MAKGFHTWIDSGREPVSKPNDGQPGAVRPMDIGFNEWMMSQCDGFVAIVPRSRQSPYQALEYQLAVRMGVPRLVALQQGGTIDASNSEIVGLPTSWKLYCHKEKEDEIKERIAAFADAVKRHKEADDVLRSIGQWRPQKNAGMPTVALLLPRAGEPDWIVLTRMLQKRCKDIKWRTISPLTIMTEQDLLAEEFDLLLLDVGPRGTPSELLGYIHALGVPQIRLCRVENDAEEQELGRYLGLDQETDDRRIYEQDPAGEQQARSVPRFLDGTKLDRKMQPVIFWATPEAAAEQILATTRRILIFRSGLSVEDGGIAQEITTHESAKGYFDFHFKRAERALVFISYSACGAVAPLADRLVSILRFLNLRCFQYRDEDSQSDGRLESGEDVEKGLEVRVEQSDVVVYLIDDHFAESEFCLGELEQGVELRGDGQIELRAYRLDDLKKFPEKISGMSLHEFREGDWSHTDVEQRIVADVKESVEAIGWALRKNERATLLNWLKKSGRDGLQGVLTLLRNMGVDAEELKSIENSAADADWFEALLRLPKESNKQQRARQIVALLLLAASLDDPDKRKTASNWLFTRRLLRWPPMIAVEHEDRIDLADPLMVPLEDPTEEKIVEIGQLVARKYPGIFNGRRPVCVTGQAGPLAVPIEWARESHQAEPIAVRRPTRWRLPDVEARPSVFESVASQDIPPTTLVLGLDGPGINVQEQTRQVVELLRDRYEDLGWPPEFVTREERKSVEEASKLLQACQDQVVHIAGHMGGEGLQVGDDVLDQKRLAGALQNGDTRLVVLNGCEGGKTETPLAVDYLTLADRLIRDAAVTEVVAHRGKISESDAQAFAKAFHTAFFSGEDGFDTARAVFKARRSGSDALRYWPVVISQR